MNFADLLKFEKARSIAYKGLSECYHMPNAELYETLIQVKRQLEVLDSEAHPHITLMRSEFNIRGNEIDDLCVDFARLFVGPYALLAPPYGSVYLEGDRTVMGNSTMDVRMRYGDSGLKLAANFKEPPDHITAEFEFMHFLIFKEMEATGQGEINSIIPCLLSQQSFLEDHLGAWVAEFAKNVVDTAKTSFYQNLARATEAFIRDDYRILSSALSSWSSDPKKSTDIESCSQHC